MGTALLICRLSFSQEEKNISCCRYSTLPFPPQKKQTLIFGLLACMNSSYWNPALHFLCSSAFRLLFVRSCTLVGEERDGEKESQCGSGRGNQVGEARRGREGGREEGRYPKELLDPVYNESESLGEEGRETHLINFFPGRLEKENPRLPTPSSSPSLSFLRRRPFGDGMGGRRSKQGR